MDNVYVVSSSKKVQNLEKDLIKELDELRGEIESGDFVNNNVKSFSSLLVPKDADYFCNERRLAIRNALQIREAMPLLAQADAMHEELATCQRSEYSINSLALLLHQFFVDRVGQLTLSKYLHMTRWARFCENTRATEALYPEYQKRLAEIMLEYQDAVRRARRLAQSREYFLTDAPPEAAIGLITDDDMVIYTRWLVCHLHSMKRVNAFLKVIQWFPISHRAEVHLSTDSSPPKITSAANKFRQTSAIPNMFRSTPQTLKTPKLSMLGEAFPSPPTVMKPGFHGNKEQPSAASFSAQKSIETQYIGDRGGGQLVPDRDDSQLPIIDARIESFRTSLDQLLKLYSVGMSCADVASRSDEMDLFSAVLRTFRRVFAQQEVMRKIDAYDHFEEGQSEAAMRSEGCSKAAKKEANWLEFVQLVPEADGERLRSIEKLRLKDFIDEVVRVQTKFMHVHAPEKVLYFLQEHMKAVNEKAAVQPSNVTTHRKGKDTSYVWNNVFSYTLKGTASTADVLNFDEKIGTEDMSELASNKNSNEVDLNLSLAAEKLGIEDEGKRSIEVQGAYMSFLVLRHLRIRDLQRTCLSLLNYFRSIERTLTINDIALTLKKGSLSSNNVETNHGCGSKGLGSHQYVHNTPADFVQHELEFMQRSEVENHDDFYSFVDGRVHVQDERGMFIIYDVAVQDFRQLEEELLLIISHYVEKHTFRSATEKKSPHSSADLQSSATVDRFALLSDAWTSELAFLECKRDAIECYLEAYQHVNDGQERASLAQVMTTLIHRRPRIDFHASYFLSIYRSECRCLQLQTSLLQQVMDVQINSQREYVQKVCRGGTSDFGLPLKVVPIQHIAINTTRLPQHQIYMLEFHPSLGLISRLPTAIQRTVGELVAADDLSRTSDYVAMETRVLERLLDEWDVMPALGQAYSPQVQKDIFSEVFVEDPSFVCEVGQSLTMPGDEKAGGKKNAAEENKRIVATWARLLEVVSLRHRLIEAAVESDLLTEVYRRVAREMSLDDCHASLRCVPFDFAQSKSELEMQPYSLTQILDDDPVVDRYNPTNILLAIQEFDEKHLGYFSFRNREGVVSATEHFAVQRLLTVVMTQLSHKHSLITALHLTFSSLNFVKHLLGKRASVSKLSLMRVGSGNLSIQPSPSVSRPLTPAKQSKHLNVTSATTLRGVSSAYGQEKQVDEAWKKLQVTFISLQGEKACIRDRMLNSFVALREKNKIKTVEETVKLKRQLVEEFCFSLHQRFSLFAHRAQIIAYYYNLHNLLSSFPTTRDSHFIIGAERLHDEYGEKKKKQPPEQVEPDPYQFKRRPLKLLSASGNELLNLWYLPHYTEILEMFSGLSDVDAAVRLKVLLRIAAALHDITQYLCAHARLGSSHARMGSQKLEFSGVTADWGGTEGIGAGLRELQNQLDRLPNPGNVIEAAAYLEGRRSVMFGEFELALGSSRDTFLTMGNQKAYKSLSNNMHFAIQNISNTCRSSLCNFQLRLPDPLIPREEAAVRLFPWRSYISRCEPFPCSYVPFHDIGNQMQTCLAGLKDIERHIVNGEVLGVSLQLEDVLVSGMPDLSTFVDEAKEEHTGGRKSRGTSAVSKSPRPQSSIATGCHPLSVKTNLDRFVNIPGTRLTTEPLLAVAFLNEFLQVWSCLELVKKEWGCRRLAAVSINSTKLHKSFSNTYKAEVLYSLFSSIKSKSGQVETVNIDDLIEEGDEIDPPENTTEYEIKIRQLIRLLENLECVAIGDCIRRISREHTLVLAERSRDDANLPTDLWKNSTMKENFTTLRPQIAENFAQKLLRNVSQQGSSVTLDTEHLNKCLVKLGTDVLHREKQAFESYASFYENLLRQQHQLFYHKEQEVKHLQQVIEEKEIASAVEIDCQLADKSHDLLVEITALRSRLSELSDYIVHQDKEIRDQLHGEYGELVLDLFNHAFEMKIAFERFQLAASDDMQENVLQVRQIAVQKMVKVKQKFGLSSDSDMVSKQLIRAEQLRQAQLEARHLGSMILKLNNLNHWNRTTTAAKFKTKLNESQDVADRATKDRLEVSLIHEEKELIIRQEQDVLRKALTQLEKEVQNLRKQLSREQNMQVKKTHNQIQEAHSMRQIELAKSSNIEKLIADLEEKDARLKELSDFNQKDHRTSLKSASETRRLLKQLMLQVQHERSLKINAFDRVDDLQKKVHDLENKIIDILNRQRENYHESCFPVVPGGSTSPSRVSRSATPGARLFLPVSPPRVKEVAGKAHGMKDTNFVVRSASEFAEPSSKSTSKLRPKSSGVSGELPKVYSNETVGHSKITASRPKSVGVAASYREYQFSP